MRPAPNDYSGFNKTYIDYTTGSNLHQILQDSLPDIKLFLYSIPEDKADYAYAEGKWTLKEVVQHCIDTERIMGYRALSVARGEQQNLPGFEQDDYAAVCDAGARTWEELLAEMVLLRQGTIIMFNSFSEERLQQRGLANNHTITCNALGFIIAGHFMHHQRIVKEKYL